MASSNPQMAAASGNGNMNNNALDTTTAAAILSQFDQNTQLQALAMLRQLNAQQQLQQMQQLQQIQQLHALTTLKKLSINDQQRMQQPSRNLGAKGQTTPPNKRVISTASRPAKVLSVSSPSFHSSSGHGNSGNRSSSGSKQNNETTTFPPVKKEMGPDGEEFVVPSDEMIEQIIVAAEYYFSDENLAKDHYLLRQICQKSEGFLSIKLLTALKNVKRLTKDWRVTSHALKKSKNLMLNQEATKVKRIAVLPEQVLKARQITNVIAIKIPMEFSSVSSITQLFAQYGKITLVRVLLPGRQVPCDLRNYATQVPDMGNTLCAVVEYETETEACNACRELNSKRFSSGLRSALLGPRLRRNLYKAMPENDDSNPMNKLDAPANTNNSWSKIVSTSPDGKKRDSGCDTASSHSSNGHSPKSERRNDKKDFDRAPGAHRKSVKMSINISTGSVIRQPKGPSGQGFTLARTVVPVSM
jgi:uncharacterized membrane protein